MLCLNVDIGLIGAYQRGVVFRSPCLRGPVGDAPERADFFAAALSETVPPELVFFFAWVLPPWVALVDWGMVLPCSPDDSGSGPR
ncbi:hypothetical protein JJ685_14880 [Ramlibacter monticola]|uniref:Uncharacterized protein n=1 Tax=Ramlibacter monticola TaxID=1926872 RepID=A0A936Z2M8_9BURK|nr:hypothetical protein [Ramlibacter monticola]